jgi:hypothetical protein
LPILVQIIIMLNTKENTTQGKSAMGESGKLHITVCLCVNIKTVHQMPPVDFQKGRKGGATGFQRHWYEVCRQYINHGAYSSHLAAVILLMSPRVTGIYTRTLSLLHSMPSRCCPSRQGPAIISHSPLITSSGAVMYFHVFALLSLPAWVLQIIDDASVNHLSVSFVHQVLRPSRGSFIENQCLLLIIDHQRPRDTRFIVERG